MDINYELYKVFYYVATTLSFSEASKLLFISQSAVSQSIKVLEKKLGITLFIRSTKRVQLTPEGETLLRHVEPAINLIARGEAQIMEAGSYDFHIRTDKDYRALYSADTPYERLFADERAVEILKKYVPEIYYGTNRKDQEAMNKCLNDSKTRAALFRNPTENFDKAIGELRDIRA